MGKVIFAAHRFGTHVRPGHPAPQGPRESIDAAIHERIERELASCPSELRRRACQQARSWMVSGKTNRITEAIEHGLRWARSREQFAG